MTPRDDMQMADVEVLLKAGWQGRHDEALAQLKLAGLRVKDIVDDEGAVEGVVAANHLNELRGLPCVAYVRTIFRYESEPPPGEGTDDVTGLRSL